jgi:hypothetical protein
MKMESLKDDTKRVRGEEDLAGTASFFHVPMSAFPPVFLSAGYRIF